MRWLLPSQLRSPSATAVALTPSPRGSGSSPTAPSRCLPAVRPGLPVSAACQLAACAQCCSCRAQVAVAVLPPSCWLLLAGVMAPTLPATCTWLVLLTTCLQLEVQSAGFPLALQPKRPAFTCPFPPPARTVSLQVEVQSAKSASALLRPGGPARGPCAPAGGGAVGR